MEDEDEDEEEEDAGEGEAKGMNDEESRRRNKPKPRARTSNTIPGPHGFFDGCREQRPFMAVEELLLSLLGPKEVCRLTFVAVPRRVAAVSPLPTPSEMAKAKKGVINMDDNSANLSHQMYLNLYPNPQIHFTVPPSNQ